MVCNRCKMVVQDELSKLGYHINDIQLGEVNLEEELSIPQKEEVNKVLVPFGFLLMDDKKSRIIEKIKNIIVETIHYQEEHLKINFSDYLSQQLNRDYKYLSNLFSEVEGTTIEQYLIAQRIEKVKELLVYDELTLLEIADRLNYSSIAHLSKQFKKVTGFSPTHFKQLKEKKRNPLEDL
ncbi:hypothetical protein BH11BAC2_BH11BAC2_12550 [soil metagenome]